MTYFKDEEGCIYQLRGHAADAETYSTMVLYRHIWPFQQNNTWVREEEDFKARFTWLPDADAKSLMDSENMYVAQDRILAARKARKES